MLYQDTLTGYLYEVPDQQLAARGPMMYDGLGNPLGLPFLAPIIGALAPAAISLVSRALSRGSSAPASPAAPAAAPSTLPEILSVLPPQVRALVARYLPGAQLGQPYLYPQQFSGFEEYPAESFAEPPYPYGNLYPSSLQGWYP